MENFIYLNPTKIIFGKNSEACIGSEVRQYSKKILFHYGEGSIKKTGLYQKVVKTLVESGIEYVELPGVKPNPCLSLVEKGIRICRDNNINFILAVGGGSVIDSAKAIGIGVPYNGNVWDFFEGKAVPKDTLPVGVVLTLAGTGSESSNSVVITNEDKGAKRAVNVDVIRPKFTVMNPELTYTLTNYQTSCGIVDAISHVIERYFTKVPNVDCTDRMCESVMKSLIKNGPIVLREPDNYDARAEIMWASKVAHDNTVGVGRIGDFASHKIEHELSSAFNVEHGAGMAVILPAWMKYVYKNNILKFVQFAVRTWNVEYYPEDIERVAFEGIERMRDFFRKLGMPVTLKELNIPESMLEPMADNCIKLAGGTIGNFRKLNKEDVINIYKIAMQD